MRVLVTGGAGFIGSNLVRSLLGAGHEVHVVDDLSSGSVENLHPAATLRTLDVTDERFLDIVCEMAPEAIVHLAAQTSVQVSLREPERDRRVNVGGTRAVAQAARACGARKVLSASSAAVYGEPVEIPLRETAQKRPTNPYGSSKLEAERALIQELRGSGVDFASLRFSNVYGPRQDWRGEGGVVALFAAAMTSGRAPVVLGSGSQTRDFVYVGDVVGAILAALESSVVLAGEGDDGPAYNVSTGTETTIGMLVAHLRAATRYGGPVEHGPEREGDVARSALDPAKARKVFGWEAGVSLETGLAMTVKWLTRGAWQA